MVGYKKREQFQAFKYIPTWISKDMTFSHEIKTEIVIATEASVDFSVGI